MVELHEEGEDEVPYFWFWLGHLQDWLALERHKVKEAFWTRINSFYGRLEVTSVGPVWREAVHHLELEQQLKNLPPGLEFIATKGE